ncbi:MULTISPECIES: N-ethylmaleimide reductase [unclassified Nocardioides]|uniref:N-ethylmaleimide reductase n=1 Tax=unclassified Nocardioides TaxID=2615069 RepID=UPI0006F60D22|nr:MULTISPECIES: N-ethylmaleimide reductase [unclassified Nocardioides]KQY56879.1 alkene reductase [Nocardioides sp. Root140]KQZ66925.1 alkene reductase [Nocardioides sp. Root151]KRF13001.1 alkene reductase [Nocardioides sp. Soil796]
MTSLFDPLDLGATRTANRVFMAPLTRMRATAPGDVPNDLMRDYYLQRAGAGLVISEGTQISPEGKGYADTPGIHSAEQVAGWRSITDAVHAAGGLMAAQLWHTGRVGHESLHDGALPVSASALEFRNRTSLKDEDGNVVRANCPTPRALETDELPRLVDDYRRSARNARDAGFDLVEVHAAHGYLLHQFLAEGSNQRTDGYGGSLENRARLLLEVVDAIIDEVGADRVGVRISPIGSFNGLDSDDDGEGGLFVARALAERGIAFVHLSEPDWAGGPSLDDHFRSQLREAFPGVIVGAGNYDLAKAQRLLAAGLVDAAAFGRSFIANPDLPARLEAGLPLNAPVLETFYGGGHEGYTDYPALADA